MEKTMYNKLLFDEASPESVGIPSQAVINFYKELKKDGFCMHGAMLIKNGQVIAEGYYAPFHKDSPHRMYSVGKSFTSVAIGLLQEEGKLSLTDKISSYFPDKLPKKGLHPYIERTTIRDLLCMASPHSYTTYKQVNDRDWVKSFFTVKPTRYPGTAFAYDTSATHVLSALVERLSGMSLFDYLKVKVLNELEFSDQIRWLTCPMGICQGGSGLICTLRDVAKFAYTCMKGGRYDGKQLIPEAYIKEATSFQISTCLQPCTEEQQGYGYQFWQTRDGGFTLYGLGGQLAVCLPKQDFMMVTMADNLTNPNGVQGIYDALWHHIYPYLMKQEVTAIPENSSLLNELRVTLSNLKLPVEKGERKTEQVSLIDGKGYHVADNPMGITQCSLTFSEEVCVFSYINESGSHTLKFGLSSMAEQKFPGTEYTCVSSAAWVTENTLHLRTYIIDECYGSVNITMTFQENTITLAMKKTAEPFLEKYEGHASGEWII
ncbi:hypothetical protein acsn021_44560 [Anaerocolumna cellulosilytica]|uniref:Beta-lactamase-related domain-containing protein n=2 Tax=Anaerocolumna cellulosilytica TaxID=433286 RepID=A0A6S6R9R6_9FIRM|nr:hypothetical protein acsn021_44560 [Anaerocolumna cellulosilytica]